MKKNLIFLACFAVVLGAASCSDDDSEPAGAAGASAGGSAGSAGSGAGAGGSDAGSAGSGGSTAGAGGTANPPDCQARCEAAATKCGLPDSQATGLCTSLCSSLNATQLTCLESSTCESLNDGSALATCGVSAAGGASGSSGQGGTAGAGGDAGSGGAGNAGGVSGAGGAGGAGGSDAGAGGEAGAAGAGPTEVNGCKAFTDHTADAETQIKWDFSIASDPDRCVKVKVGSKLVFTGDFSFHPLASKGGDSPNPFDGAMVAGNKGTVEFTAAGTFGYVCTNHGSMNGAVFVVP